MIVNACDPRLNPADLRGRVRRELPLPRHGDDALGAPSRTAATSCRAERSVKISSRRPTPGANAVCSHWSASVWSPGSPTSSRGTRPITCSAPIDEIGVRDGADLVVEGYDFAPTFSIWTTIEECLNPPVVWERERGFFTLAAVLGARDVRVPRRHRPDRVRARRARRGAADPAVDRMPDASRSSTGSARSSSTCLQMLAKTGLASTKPVKRARRRGLAA